MSNLIQMRKRLVILTGAGFSRSVSKRFFTTQEFHSKYAEKLDPGNWLRYIEGLVRKEQGGTEADVGLDAEVLSKKLRQVIDAWNTVMPYPEANIRIDSGTQLASYTFNVPAQKLRSDLSGFLAGIRNAVLRDLRFDVLKPEEMKKVNDIRNFINNLHKEYDLNIFSTNYDTLIREIYGTAQSGYYLDGKQIIIERLLNNGKPFSYIPLKGMVDWRRSKDREDLFIEGSDWDNDSKDHIFMPFEDEATPNKNPHNKFYAKFTEDLSDQNTKVMLFIGFSFRDDYIKNLITNHLTPKHRVMVVVQDDLAFKTKIKEEIFFKITPSNFCYIKDGFDAKAHKVILDKLAYWSG